MAGSCQHRFIGRALQPHANAVQPGMSEAHGLLHAIILDHEVFGLESVHNCVLRISDKSGKQDQIGAGSECSFLSGGTSD